MGAEKLRKSAFKHVEGELFSYHDTRKELIRLRNEILYGSHVEDENIGGGRSNLPGDPTGRKVTTLVSHKKLQHLEMIVESIESIYDRLPEHKKRVVNLYYWTRPQTLTWEGIAQKCNISRRQALVWRDEVIYSISELIGWR
jgi:RinA family phage transcriptional activator